MLSPDPDQAKIYVSPVDLSPKRDRIGREALLAELSRHGPASDVGVDVVQQEADIVHRDPGDASEIADLLAAAGILRDDYIVVLHRQASVEVVLHGMVELR